MNIAKRENLFIYATTHYIPTWNPLLLIIWYTFLVDHGLNSWVWDTFIYVMSFCFGCPLLSPLLDNYQGLGFSIDFDALFFILHPLHFVYISMFFLYLCANLFIRSSCKLICLKNWKNEFILYFLMLVVVCWFFFRFFLPILSRSCFWDPCWFFLDAYVINSKLNFRNLLTTFWQTIKPK